MVVDMRQCEACFIPHRIAPSVFEATKLIARESDEPVMKPDKENGAWQLPRHV
jgi:ferredoxin